MNYTKPTKFELMRTNQHIQLKRKQMRIQREMDAAAREVLQEMREQVDLIRAAPAVPTMEVDGVKYREAPEAIGCVGCAFYGLQCTAGLRDLGRATFGGSCNSREVIYIKAA